jgi:uncharacterized protein
VPQHDQIDRITPTLEPDQPVLLHQNWRHLLFLHWEVPPAELQKLLPHRLTVDLHDGKAYVGLVPFTLDGVRPVMTPPLPWISHFHEVNVRTYVHRDGRDPGVWFFSLDASSAIAVAAARAAYKLPYFGAEMDFSVGDGPYPEIGFQSRRTDTRGALPANAHVRYQPVEGPVTAAAPGTFEHFLVERYVLYSEDHERRLHRARVHHQPYPLQKAEVYELDESLIWAAGIRRPENFVSHLYAKEVNVKVYPLESV